jgi:hypothetical protein
VQSAGGFVSTLQRADLIANRRDPLLSGLLASGPFLQDELLSTGAAHPRARTGALARRIRVAVHLESV